MRIIPRSEAGLAPPKRSIAAIGPKGLVFRHHSVTDPDQHPTTFEHARYIQRIAFNRGFWDISYSFLIFPNGDIIEGRGWGKLGAHTQDYNAKSWGFCFPGNYQTRKLTEAQILSYRWLIWEGKRTGWITGGPDQRPHKAVAQTACAGNDVDARAADLNRPWDGSEAPQPQPQPEPQPQPQPTTDWTEEMIVALPVLKNGSRGQHVRNLQGLLIANGRNTAIDGIFGSGTEAKVKDWQAAAGVAGGADGIVGKNTWRGLIGA